MDFEDRLKGIVLRRAELRERLMDFASSADYQKASKEFADVDRVAQKAEEYLKVVRDISEAAEALKEDALDQEMRCMLQEEMDAFEQHKKSLYSELSIMLLPKDSADKKGAMLEIRAGTGGEEAALFAANLLNMYRRYAELREWSFEVIAISETGIDGCKEATVAIGGYGVFERMKYESGVHRVQRVPETESSGRIHTSAATVAILPEAEEIDVNIRDEDIKIDSYRASGAGGQHVNTTDSAIRITHLPTGIVVCQQDEKSQHKNKAKALRILRSRVYEAQRNEQEEKRSSARKGMVGSGDRSERIRTYNYPQGRVTDHRVNVTSYNLSHVINDGQLDQFIDVLIAEDNAAKLAGEGLDA